MSLRGGRGSQAKSPIAPLRQRGTQIEAQACPWPDGAGGPRNGAHLEGQFDSQKPHSMQRLTSGLAAGEGFRFFTWMSGSLFRMTPEGGGGGWGGGVEGAGAGCHAWRAGRLLAAERRG